MQRFSFTITGQFKLFQATVKKSYTTSGNMYQVLPYEEILAASARISASPIKKTPVLTCAEANRISGKQLYFKSEHLQCTGSFKARGAMNAVLKLKECAAGTSPTVVTHSSGNHGQAIAWACSSAGIPSTVVAPEGTPACKLAAIRGYGADIVICEPNPTGRENATKKIVQETGATFISSCQYPEVMAGQGTCAVELLEQVPDLDAIFCTVSVGGLSSGICTAVRTIKPDIKIFLVTPEGKMLEDCLRTGERLWPNPPQFLKTIADGIRIQQLDKQTFPTLQALAEYEVFEVPDAKMVEAMKFSFHRMKQVIEPAAGAALAAVLSDKMSTLPANIQKIGVVLCGGNVDIESLPW